MGLTRTIAPASLAVTLDDLSSELLSYAQSIENDAVVTQKLYEAIEYLEAQTQRSFIQSTWTQTWDDWPDDPCGPKGNGTGQLKLSVQPLVSVTSVKYYDTNSVQQTVDPSKYWIDLNSKPPRIKFKPTLFTWPPVEPWRPSAIEVVFIAGYADASSVPYMAKLAIKQLAAYWFEQREAASVNGVAAPGGTETQPGKAMPYGVTNIINMLRADGYT